MVEAFGVQDSLTLRGGKLAKAAEGASDVATLIRREFRELLHGSPNLFALREREVLHGFIALKQALPLFRRHCVEPDEGVAHALLSLRRQIVEAGFVFESSLLLIGSEVAVAIHPLSEVIAAGLHRAGLHICRMRMGTDGLRSSGNLRRRWRVVRLRLHKPMCEGCQAQGECGDRGSNSSWE